MAAFARWCGATASVRREIEDGETYFDITIEGGSGFLNGRTDDFAEAASRIALDISPQDQGLMAIALDAGAQLRDQKIIHEPGEIVFLPTRASREGFERLQGEASMETLLRELAIQESRLAADIKNYNNAAGPRAWKKRESIAFLARIDALSIINCARRMERIARDLRTRLGGNSHLSAALQVFRQNTAHVTDLRNISEHLDEYVVGAGRMDDPSQVEPGEVFELIVERQDVVLSARSRSARILSVAAAVKVLCQCVQNTTEARFMELTWADGIDFDYAIIEDDGTSRILREEEYPPEVLGAKEAMARSRQGGIPFSQQVRGNCADCGSLL
ncbi:hypothetical protein AB0C07_18150 [Actinoplanes missouriensis]|uniref:hypothetical protein n=1 Tax=Actinoplanes missouriensis TaxID=1866 RepID=UPI003408CC57